MDLESSSKVHARQRRGRSRVGHEQRFTSYLPFGLIATVCLVIFLLVYAVTLLVLSPLLNQSVPHTSHIKRGDVLRPVMKSAVEKVKDISHVGDPGHLVAQGLAGVIKKQFNQFRNKKGVTDAELLSQAAAELNASRKRKQEERVVAKPLPVANIPVAPGKTTGFMVLGMHRSGTSMLSGLMATGLGYKVGGPLIGGAFDNEKGFFERIDVVLQNDEFMNKQGVWWSSNTVKYDAEKALTMLDSKKVDFKNGKTALEFFNDPKSSPWLQKDPRQCLTLRTWLKLMSSEPAILFTYRHPLEVANSLKKRENDFPVERGLRLWIVYNMRAIQNSKGLCIVYSSNEAVLEKPLEEVTRISQELTSKCGVPKPPSELKQEEIDRFIDPNLQHNKKDDGEGRKVLADHEGCQVREYDSNLAPDSPGFKRELELYLQAMKIYCDFKSGKAYQPDYEWPTLP